MDTIPKPPLAARSLERALVLTFVAHVLAMAGMIVFLLPGIPGGLAASSVERATYIAAHPWLWRAGWLGWQLTAASDLYLAIALFRTSWIPKAPAWFSLVVTLLALLPDQIGQYFWSVHGPYWAAASLAEGNAGHYAEVEERLFQVVGGWGAGLYLVSAIGWTVCLHRAGTWSRTLTWLSVATWSMFAAAVTMLFVPQGTWTPTVLKVAGGLNAVAFVLLLGWIASAGEQVMLRARPVQIFGRHAVWTHPNRGLYGRVVNYLANSRFVQGVFKYVPALAMVSDIRDVIYVNYLVDAEKVAPLVTSPLQIQRLGSDDRLAMYTFLIYRHGHFGPRVFGPFRRLWQSPIQSNWRLYVKEPASGLKGVYFLTTSITATPYALAARLLSDGVPMHVPRSAEIDARPNGNWVAITDPGDGTSPDVRIDVQPLIASEAMPVHWQDVFGSSDAAMAYCVPQNRAINVQPWYERIVVQEIRLDIPLASCVRLHGTIDSLAARAIVGDAEPFCFYVPNVRFFYAGERYR